MAANEHSNHEPRPTGRSRNRQQLNRRLRAAFIAGAEDRSRQDQGRGLTETELRGILEQYPGDLASEESSF
jgi:hypothetical protein